jgi:hypothetical protein
MVTVHVASNHDAVVDDNGIVFFFLNVQVETIVASLGITFAAAGVKFIRNITGFGKAPGGIGALIEFRRSKADVHRTTCESIFTRIPAMVSILAAKSWILVV